ncbi:hypothetical protein CICLE_v10016689mg [Citrus x clementina]|uniref:Uncharacterized protein n=1 Tax=Citrus clementina TaxID=85681 RepID=V4W9V5_CITCL|nr:GATA zinc finger domain-containing protein 24 [Citrus x clementina]ESR63084.1 hypothetical protein CICLE_v10016689mg [Citrus x clementina]GAY35318.1 hypothetical protein CUMW_015590 [Citrus unshiu]
MEGVGARLGRSSTRYGPATVFSGPVRKWKKRWIHVSPSNNSSGNNNHAHQNLNNSSNGNASSTNGNNGSHLLLYKWAPLSQRDNGGNNNGNSINGGGKDSVKDDTAPDEPPRRKFKYIPIAVLEEQKRAAENEAAENAENDAKPTNTDPSAAEPVPRNDGFDGKPDINDVPMEENQDDEQIVRQDLNESTLDLRLGLKAHDGDSDSRTDQT